MKHLLIIMSLALGLGYTGYAQQAPQTHSFSLADCINYAYQHQDSVKNAQLDVQSAEYKVKETIGIGLPQINGSATFQDFIKPPVSVGPNFLSGQPIDPKARLVTFPFGPIKYNNTYSLQATQLLFSGTFIVGLQAVKTFKELSERSLIRSKIETNVNVTKAYYQVLVSGEQIKLLDANIAQLKQQFEQTAQRNKQGFVEKIDVDRLDVQYNNLVTNRENVVRALVLYNQMLKFQMGMPVEDELLLTDKLESINIAAQVGPNTVDTTFYRNRIEYKLLQTNITLNELDVKSRKAEFLPTFAFNAGIAGVFQENQTKFLYDNVYYNSYIGLSLNIPIFSGGQRLNRLRQTQISVLKAKNDLSNAANGFKLMANAANVTYLNSLQSLNNQKRSRELAQEVLRVAKIKYEQGVGSSVEVTQAQTELENADNQYIQALYTALISKVDADKAYARIN
ncbi:TolC family protein [Mucilaginibacter auburnensis]|uniref:Outer membrane protein TolC n=1 Tax=Mucilaginibacter auburnensis TaxID=1457233 RepID=A0A2H9VVL3_9SPHI|nr:TolC family protein [Mucilaginibacter auburnensis]PJJ84858.1 outer membrane protein TolC [Mucilaginibacter auburnensis]